MYNSHDQFPSFLFLSDLFSSLKYTKMFQFQFTGAFFLIPPCGPLSAGAWKGPGLALEAQVKKKRLQEKDDFVKTFQVFSPKKSPQIRKKTAKIKFFATPLDSFRQNLVEKIFLKNAEFCPRKMLFWQSVGGKNVPTIFSFQNVPTGGDVEPGPTTKLLTNSGGHFLWTSHRWKTVSHHSPPKGGGQGFSKKSIFLRIKVFVLLGIFQTTDRYFGNL